VTLSPYKYLKIARRGAVVEITLDRPDRLNAVNPEMSRELLACLQSLTDDEDANVAVLSGAGRAFCAGGDLSLEDTFTPTTFRRELELYADTVLAILSCSKPIICAMNGDAVGWGATLALFCDIIIANRKARIGDPHVTVGLSTGDGASVIWPQLAGYPRAKEFLLTGDLMSAEQAVGFGLINEAVDAELLRPRVDQLADRIAAKPRLAVARSKASINIPLKQIVRASMDAYIEHELETQRSPEHPAAVKQFLSRRSTKTT
jgi:enoyl-CoA hydratase